MGLQLDEIGPLPGLTKLETVKAAKMLCSQAEHGLIIHGQTISTVLEQHFASFKHPDPIGFLLDTQWLLEDPLQVGFGHHKITSRMLNTYKIASETIDIAHTIISPRMSFQEACIQICAVRKRLDAFPLEIDGMYLNNVYLFGSSLRDPQKPHITKDIQNKNIGDIDLLFDLTFDQRHNNNSWYESEKLAYATINPLIKGNDDRIQAQAIREWAGVFSILSHEWDVGSSKPFVMQRIWHRKTPYPSTMLVKNNVWIKNIEARTLASQQRARVIHKLLKQEADGAPTIPLKRLSAGLRKFFDFQHR